MLAVVAALLFVQCNGCEAEDDRVLDTLKASGLKDPTLGDPDAMACAEAERSRHFTATNVRGERVTGTVCCGLTRIGKGCTIRWGR